MLAEKPDARGADRAQSCGASPEQPTPPKLQFILELGKDPGLRLQRLYLQGARGSVPLVSGELRDLDTYWLAYLICRFAIAAQEGGQAQDPKVSLTEELGGGTILREVWESLGRRSTEKMRAFFGSASAAEQWRRRLQPGEHTSFDQSPWLGMFYCRGRRLCLRRHLCERQPIKVIGHDRRELKLADIQSLVASAVARRNQARFSAWTCASVLEGCRDLTALVQPPTDTPSLRATVIDFDGWALRTLWQPLLRANAFVDVYIVDPATVRSSLDRQAIESFFNVDLPVLAGSAGCGLSWQLNVRLYGSHLASLRAIRLESVGICTGTLRPCVRQDDSLDFRALEDPVIVVPACDTGYSQFNALIDRHVASMRQPEIVASYRGTRT